MTNLMKVLGFFIYQTTESDVVQIALRYHLFYLPQTGKDRYKLSWVHTVRGTFSVNLSCLAVFPRNVPEAKFKIFHWFCVHKIISLAQYDTTVNISTPIRITFCWSLALPRNYSFSVSINFTRATLLSTSVLLYWAHGLFCLLFLIYCQ